MQRIVVAVDGSEESKKALSMAIDLASKTHAELDAVSIAVAPYVPPEPFGVATAGLEQAVRDYATVVARSAADEARKAGVTADWQVEQGMPADAICEVAETKKADMIVCGSRGQGALRRALLGSVSSRLVHIAAVPVLVVH